MNLETFKAVMEIFALVFTGAQILLLTVQIRNAVKWNRLNSTFMEINKLSNLIIETSPELLDEIGLIKYDEGNVDVNVFKKLINDPKYERELYRIMHFYESFSVSVLSGYINENIAKRMCFANIIRTHNKMAGYILLRRQTSGYDLYQHFEKLYNKWNSEGINLKENHYETIRRRKNEH